MKKTLIGIAAVIAALASQAEFAYTIVKEVSGYSGTSALANVPVLVRIPAEYAALCRADGADLKFTSEDGTVVYPHEIDVWRADGESCVWVKLPSMEKNTRFAMHFGDPEYTGPATPQAKGAVWDDAGYVGVWHMSEESGNVANATSALGDGDVALDAVPKGARAAYSVRYSASTDTDAANDPAPVGYARYTGAKQSGEGKNNRAYLEVPNYNCQNLGGNFAISGWCRMSEFVGGYDGFTRNGRMFARKTQYNAGGGFSLAYNRSATEMNLRGASDSGNDGLVSWVPSAFQSWVHFTFVFGRDGDGKDTLSLYANGAFVKSGTLPSTELSYDNGLPLGIGSNVNTGMNNDSYVAGSFDEVRLRRTASGGSYGDWIKAEYDMCTSDSFLTNAVNPISAAEIGVSYEANAATFSVKVSSLGDGSEWCDVYWGYGESGTEISADALLGRASAADTAFTATASDLVFLRDYQASFRFVNSKGVEVVKTVSFSPTFSYNAVCLVPDADNPPAGAAELGYCEDSLALAIQYSATATGKLVYVYPGTYAATTDIAVPEGVEIRGVSTEGASLPKINLGSSYVMTLAKNARVSKISITGSADNKTLATLGENAVLSDSEIVDCSGFVFAVVLEGKNAKVSGCRFADCISEWRGTSVIICRGAGGNVVENTSMDNCRVSAGNYGAPIQLYSEQWGQVSANGSLALSRVSVTGCKGRAGVIRQDSGSLYCTNCLFAANICGNGDSWAILPCNSAQRFELVNCTVASNSGYGMTFGGSTSVKCLARNSIVWGNKASGNERDIVDIGTHTVANCCFAEAGADDANGNIAIDPKLRVNYMLSGSSPCRNAGDNLTYVETDVDLAGNRRKHGPRVDMGCYECPLSGLACFVR